MALSVQTSSAFTVTARTGSFCKASVVATNVHCEFIFACASKIKKLSFSFTMTAELIALSNDKMIRIKTTELFTTGSALEARQGI